MNKNPRNQPIELERLAPGLRRYARALVAREAADPVREADALTRDTLARAARVERAGRIGNHRLWLYATLVTLNRARLRARSEVADNAKSSRQSVTEAVGGLPLDQREALLLVVLEGFTYAEAANVLGLPRPAVAIRLARARMFLAERLATDRLEPGPKPLSAHPHLRVVK